jgi:hypothetical protein
MAKTCRHTYGSGDEPVLPRQSTPGHKLDCTSAPNTLADFPADRFAIHALCECGHQARVPTETLPPALRVDVLRAALRCQVCGSRQVRISIVWTAAGGYAHCAGMSWPDPPSMEQQ